MGSRELMVPRALDRLTEPRTPQVAKEQGGCCHLSDGILEGQPSLTVLGPGIA